MKKIIDDWLDQDLVEFLEHNFLYEKAHWFGHSSLDKHKNINDNFYSHLLDSNEPINKYLFYKLKKTLDINLSLLRMYLNIQWKEMNGSFHTDDGDITCLYMATKTRKKDSAFQIKGTNKIKFVQNRLICFDSNKMHRGLAPDDGVRITLAFKTKIIK
tara:strand:- start:3071 stop:3544 length:474 start_codon:yes stop_codon:yes gene_type:complete